MPEWLQIILYMLAGAGLGGGFFSCIYANQLRLKARKDTFGSEAHGDNFPVVSPVHPFGGNGK